MDDLDTQRQQLIQFANEMDEKRQKKVFEIILSDIDILNEIEIVKARLELLFLEEKKTSFYPHKLTIRQHINESQIYLSDLYEAYSNNNKNRDYKQPVVIQKKVFQKNLNSVIDDLSQMMLEK